MTAAVEGVAAGRVNPLTHRLLMAEEAILAAIGKVEAGGFAIPLYTVIPSVHGKGVGEWPNDPELCAPEEIAYLTSVRGEEAVAAWVAQHFYMKDQAARYDEEAVDIGGPESVAAEMGGY